MEVRGGGVCGVVWEELCEPLEEGDSFSLTHPHPHMPSYPRPLTLGAGSDIMTDGAGLISLDLALRTPEVAGGRLSTTRQNTSRAPSIIQV